MFFKKKAPHARVAIGITTFERRFDRYFEPLVTRIRQYEPDVDIVVAVNGENGRPFDEGYRRRLLAFLSTQPRTFPVVFPEFRGLSKLWNTLLVHAPADFVLMLNDDVMIHRPDFMAQVGKRLLRNRNGSYLINRSWSHFLASRDQMDALGYFDERLLGIGEEDGDMTWRYRERFGAPIPSFTISGFENFSEETLGQEPVNVRCRPGSKYSVFNRRFMFETKYRADAAGVRGMFDAPVVLRDAGPPQYPNERFFREHRHLLAPDGGGRDR